MFFIDLKYLRMISFKLIGFTQKKSDLFNCRCPLCGDSSKNSSKKRGFFYNRKNEMYYKCFNCEVSIKFNTFLKDFDEIIYKEYRLEKFLDKQTKPKISTNQTKQQIFNDFSDLDLGIPNIKSLEENHIAKKYILERKIPKKFYKDLFFCDDFKTFIKKFNNKINVEKFPENDKRIIIPFRGFDGKIFAIQGRSISTFSKLKYITVKLNDQMKLFGLERLNRKKFINVVEGPIDSLFLENCVATADSNLEISEFLGKENQVLIYDNQPRNKQIVKRIKTSIDNGFFVCIFPPFVKEKDINEMILAGYSKPHISKLIEQNTYKDVRAKLEFNNWKKC